MGFFDRIIDRLYPRTEKYFQNQLKKQVKRHFDAIHMLKELQNKQQLPEFKDDTNTAFEISQAKHDVDFSEFTIEQLVKSMKKLEYKIPKELFDDYPFLIELVKK